MTTTTQQLEAERDLNDAKAELCMAARDYDEASAAMANAQRQLRNAALRLSVVTGDLHIYHGGMSLLEPDCCNRNRRAESHAPGCAAEAKREAQRADLKEAADAASVGAAVPVVAAAAVPAGIL